MPLLTQTETAVTASFSPRDRADDYFSAPEFFTGNPEGSYSEFLII